MNVSLRLLKNLARTCSEDTDDLEGIEPTVSTLEIKQAVKKKQDLLAKQTIDEYAQMIIDLLALKNAQVSSYVHSIREKMEEKSILLASIKELDHLEMSAMEDNNWLPLALMLGVKINT